MCSKALWHLISFTDNWYTASCWVKGVKHSLSQRLKLQNRFPCHIHYSGCGNQLALNILGQYFMFQCNTAQEIQLTMCPVAHEYPVVFCTLCHTSVIHYWVQVPSQGNTSFGKCFEVLIANTWPLQLRYQQFFNIY